MDIIYLLLACLFFSAQYVFQKCFQRNTKGGFSVSMWNQFVMYGFMVLYLGITTWGRLDFGLTSLLYAVLYGAAGLTSSAAGLFAMRYGKVSVVTTFSLLGGMVVPFVYGLLFLREPVTMWKLLGILVLIASLFPALLGQSAAEGEQGRHRGRFLTFGLLVFFGNGLTGVFSKAHQISPDAVDTDSFVFQCAVVCLTAAAVILSGQTLILRKKGERGAVRQVFYEIGKQPMKGKLFGLLIGLMACYALCNGLGNIFSLRCALTMDSSIQFPLISSTVILMTTVLGRVFYKEKIARANQLSLLLTLAGIGLFIISG